MSPRAGSMRKVSKHIPKSRVADALAIVARDTHGRYDECFVERLLESSIQYLKENPDAEERLLQLYETFKSNRDDVNITRLLKIHKTLVEANSPTPSPPCHLTDVFLVVFPVIFVRDNPSEVAAALSLFLALAYDDSAFKHLEKWRVSSLNPENSSYQGTNILSIARYYMLSSRNYHIEENAKYLFISLIMKLSEYHSATDLSEELKQMLEELLMDIRVPMVYHVISELFEIAPENCLRSELFAYIRRILRRAFDNSFQNPSCQSLLGLSRCLAQAKISPNETIDKLKRVNSLEAIMMYVTNMNVFNNSSLFYFVIYPLLVKCDSEDAQVLAAKLFMTREEKYFIERNLKDKSVQQCLTYLRLAAIREPPFRHYYNSNTIPIKKLNYSYDVVLEYLKCNYEDPKVYKNLLECCKILIEGQNGLKKSIWLFHLIETILQLVERTDIKAKPHLKPIFLELLQLLAKSHHRTTVFRSHSKLNRIGNNWYRTVDLAFQFTDPDVLCEFANFFDLTSCGLMSIEPKQVRYVRLIWDHMLPIAKGSEHYELLTVIAAILIKIDLDMPNTSLEVLNIRRHREIPRLISDILINFSTVYSVVEKVIKCLVSVDANEPTQSQDSDGRQWAKTKIGYLEWLDGDMLPSSVKTSLDQLIKGICTVIKGECDEDIKIKAITEINSLIKTLLINDDLPRRLLKRLVRTGIVDMLHVICNCALYSENLQQIAGEELPHIRKHILEKLGPEEVVVEIIHSVLLEDKSDSPELRNTAKRLAQFLITKSDCKRMKREAEKESNPDRLGLISYLNDILDYERMDWGPSECY